MSGIETDWYSEWSDTSKELDAALARVARLEAALREIARAALERTTEERDAAKMAIVALEWADKSGDHLLRRLNVLVGNDESMGLNRKVERNAMDSWIACAANIDATIAALRRALEEKR